ncbi:AAA family ATPase [Jiangella endophytica]|uniref:AAA family ATPase n=1 Tax=Jiangella endophytica TaxID=1623398 RepID=UPI0018E56A8E|nr:ATP-binding protein [Jiangella endophytica]
MTPAVWMIAGAPGAGKTTVARKLAARLDPVPALLDKDTVYAPFVVATLEANGRPFGEREGPWYDEHIKVHEYAGLADTAREVRSAGCPVILVAPFTGQTRDLDAWAAYVERLGGDPVRLLWVRSDGDTLRERILGRGHDRDGQKLANFADFTAATFPDVPPPAPHTEIDNRRGAPPLDDQLAAAVAAA